MHQAFYKDGDVTNTDGSKIDIDLFNKWLQEEQLVKQIYRRRVTPCGFGTWVKDHRKLILPVEQVSVRWDTRNQDPPPYPQAQVMQQPSAPEKETKQN